MLHLAHRLADARRGGGIHTEAFHPSHQTRERRAELMCGLLGHADPDIALLAPFDVAEADVGDENEDGGDGKLAHREPAELTDQVRFAVMHIVHHERVIDRDADGMVLLVHLSDQAGEECILLGWRQSGRVDVLAVLLGVPRVREDHGEVDRADDLEREREVAGIRVVARDILQGARIERHDLPFAREELVGDALGEQQQGDDEDGCEGEEQDPEVSCLPIGSPFAGRLMRPRK